MAAATATAATAAAAAKSTRDLLLSLIDDIELVAKEIIENAVARKPAMDLRAAAVAATAVAAATAAAATTAATAAAAAAATADDERHAGLAELLVRKDRELRAALERAAEQARIDSRMEALKAEVDRQDRDVGQLRRQLKEAERILATAVYQAKRKLRSIARANGRPVPSEDLVRYAHRISASNAVCAPLAWQQGDPRRPYPTDIEMRLGYLGRLSDLPPNGQMLGSHPGGVSSSDLHRTGHPVGAVGDPTVSQADHRFAAWHPSGEIHVSMTSGGGGGQGTVAMNATRKQETEDVEVMSTDSSSSSSSDSQ